MTFAELREKKDLTIVAMESSCDETACAVLREGRILSSVISSQIDIHKEYGGVVPEIASRNHVINIEPVVKEALDKAGITAADADCFAVTYGAGLLGALFDVAKFYKSLFRPFEFILKR